MDVKSDDIPDPRVYEPMDKYSISLPTLRERAFLLWVFVTHLNGFIRIAAEDAELRWLQVA